MKRSDINEILGHTRQFFSMHDVHLPPFASFPPTKWQQLDQAAWQEVFDLRLGWDVTAFGGNNFAAEGLTLFTLRNGSSNGMPYEKTMPKKSCTCGTARSRRCIFTGVNGKTSSTGAAGI